MQELLNIYWALVALVATVILVDVFMFCGEMITEERCPGVLEALRGTSALLICLLPFALLIAYLQ